MKSTDEEEKSRISRRKPLIEKLCLGRNSLSPSDLALLPCWLVNEIKYGNCFRGCIAMEGN